MPEARAATAGRASLGLVAVGLAVCSVILTLDHVGARAGAPVAPAFERSPGPSVVWTPSATRPPSALQGYGAVPRAREAAAGAPDRVVVDALGIDVPVVPIHLEVSTLVPPSDPQTLGWWADGAEPGAKRGSAIITGHTVHTGGGALDNLESLVPGDVFSVRTDAGSIDYWVSRVEVHDKDRVSRAAKHLFSQQVRGRLVLITCEDWDGTGYASNVVVIARPV
ncbi:class F sortase [Nocardioides allogilvus]|uniref:class F sortase n=1 Tax=Nocardioides allogilvus TaxID=2072017 RepID=UPI001E2A0E8C|nr:class F sortase [Nocardioides allogilvus]